MKFTDSKGIEYDNLTFLDKGGMGRVYKGISPITKEPVVLKLIEHIPDSTDEKQKREEGKRTRLGPQSQPKNNNKHELQSNKTSNQTSARTRPRS